MRVHLRRGRSCIGLLLLVQAIGSAHSLALSSEPEKGVHKGLLGSVTQGLVGYWDFDEGQGDIADDQSPFGNDGILNNGPTWLLGAQNGAIGFDGVDDYVDCGNGPGLEALNDTFTVTFRMRTTRRGASEFILYKNGLYTGFYFRTHADDKLLFKLDDGTNDVYRSSDTTAPTDGNWHFVAARVIGRTAMDLYIDGLPQSDGWNNLSLVGSITTTDVLTLGGTTDDPSAHFLGDLDDVRIYDRALTVSEILDIFNEWDPPEEVTPTPGPPTPIPSPTPTPNGGGGTPIPSPTPTPDGSGGPPIDALYVRPAGGSYGNEDGSDWANALDGLPANPLRGRTYYLADGSYPGRIFSVPTEGSKKVQIFKATLEDHGTQAGWSSTFGDGTAVFTGRLNFRTANWVLDGRRRNDDWKSGYGIRIEALASKGVQILRDDVSGVTLRHVEIEGRGDDGAGSPDNDLIYITGNSPGFTLSRCYLHDSGRTHLLIRNADDGLIEYCYIARNESTAAQHAEAISAYPGAHRWTVRHSYWEDIDGTGIIMFAGDGWELYGNTCFTTGTRSARITNGSFATWAGMTVTNARIFNNTFARLSGGGGLMFNSNTGSIGNFGYNNMWFECDKVRFTGIDHDFNWFYESENQTEPNRQMATGDPFVDSANHDYNLTEPTQPGYDSLGVPYHVDPMDRLRGADGVWDRGAFELGEVFVEGPETGSLFHVEDWRLYK